MKKTLLLSTMLVTSIGMLNAQTMPDYQRFIQSIETTSYAPLSSSATEVIFPNDGASWDDDQSEPITIPFNFKYQKVDIPQLSIESNGALIIKYPEENFQIFGLYMDLAAGSGDRGKVYYETTGTEGNRIFKIEFRNVSTYMNYTGNDTVNMQIHLHEGSNIIDIVAGYCNIPVENFISTVEDLSEEKELLISGLISNAGDYISVDETESYAHLTVPDGSGYRDTLILVDVLESETISLDEFVKIALKGYPTSGTVIRYTPRDYTSAPSIIAESSVNLYPNPSSKELFVEVQDYALYTYEIYDIQGRKVMNGQLKNTAINIEHLAAGQYIIQLHSAQHMGSFKFTKK